jgi:AAA+ superfamily predicted ATPase
MASMKLERCRDELARVVRSARVCASARLVLLMTRDREEALALVESVAAQEKVLLRHVTPAAFRTYDSQTLTWSRIDASDRTPPDMLEEARGCKQDSVVIVEEFLGLIKDGSPHVKARLVLLELLAESTRMAGLTLVCVEAPEAEAHVPSMIAAQVVKLAIGYPKAGDLAALARSEVAAYAHRARVPLEVAAIRQGAPAIAEGLVGLTRKAARDALHDALAIEPADLRAAANHLAQEKTQRLSRELSMEVLDTSAGKVPEGVEYLLEYLQIQKPRMRVYGRGRARGVLLIGPPGTGKTMLARALGHLTDLPVVVFRVGSLMNSLLGETERLFARAFSTLEALSPCLVFVDEIDKAFAVGGAELDGGTMTRVTGSLLEWLSNNQSPNFVIGASNNLARLAEAGAMTRSERFDQSFWVDVPNRRARQLILRDALWELIDRADVERVSGDLAMHSAKLSGADLYSCVKHAAAVSQHAGRRITADDVCREIDKKRPRAEALYEEFAPLRRWAKVHCEMAGAYDHTT